MKLRTTIASLTLAVIAPLTLAACSDSGTDAATSTSSTSSTTTDTTTDTATTDTATTDTATTGDRPDGAPDAQGGGPGGGPGGVDAASVTTEAELVALVQAAYGEAELGLHRGHQPIEDVLDTVLGISHDELHVRMEEQGQNLAAVADDLRIDPQTLIDALVAQDAVAIDALLADGTLTEAEAQAYTAALEEAYTFRVTWDGQEATPSFTGLA